LFWTFSALFWEFFFAIKGVGTSIFVLDYVFI
jgi:hypothetical protein